MRILVALFTLAMSAATAAADPTLGTTAADKLGTMPDGYGVKVGTKAPDAKLVDITGKPVTLAALYQQGPTFVVFYRGGWCPFCNAQLHALTEAKAKFDAKGVRLVAISVDVPGEEAKMQAKHGVPFPMLSDPKLVAIGAFHVIKVNSEADKAKLGVDLAKYSGESHGNFAVPSIFLIDTAGVVRWAHVDPEFKVRPSVDQLLAAFDKAMAKR